ncbi:MAG: hypothetical protein A2268_09535 [Candidatus Raymondbacteria bacterium RifOxyA12_full_50_37]|uniref:Ion-translocating oxidoreductase complex subunit G n=1 Tax=Candidatus Raymondbacteria bacterium RIFOXYD12_FULL_49_13 TaxID=1817890 RepID=A0A1F7F1R8_UNCRA|nr:MAG: hypothetical protein A2268_09535 [Candidatus Raymondbacteria bacterium RifOxyA12_full_50_37]OGJ93132.1 MAG: hypothetical protein A2350_17725 [Candidatus Raymondbacteria bacterium RifOxyB12_full_50_8]OGJ93918.1 MAG: hypothetical protein A2248_06760 [Candidatus Raymondbacteria bacterium RIFOXYA2_FULL_49_16]OGJ98213.1 MAG: hypothetical protein A2453_00405 [Candidatus Raymondbacteria bacterium RIFOXYC2_FULL_50_21]OGK00446.1 MAG: hypothetical protein A2519_10580 [Candidatus Raymondbacteria b
MKDTVRYITVLAVICATAAGLLAYVNQKTLGPIAAVNNLIKVNAIREVLASAIPDLQLAANPDSDRVIFHIPDSETGKDKEISFYRARNASGSCAGYAVKTASLVGYAGAISLMVGLSLEGKITGTCVLEQKETPGLGTKIKDVLFSGQFIGLVRAGSDIKIKKFGGSIESVTGASISSHAYTAAVNEALKLYEKKLKGQQ